MDFPSTEQAPDGRAAATPANRAAHPAAHPAPGAECETYEPPLVLDLGRVREVTLGSSGSGTADANSQYYW
ncbi:lasso RiPP family leader peptide-containing protein [Streptomyces sp. YIM 98790]|uniref:lasso RiPP family leader peptide-containing protein n=1 Tax=Streptomyces sp. YIM 98790 TaxID=2689077 RepID=UPI00140AA19D|nr:lasso RiPP family leader peptide-containing protein [Streptomyces sp. YIM 98790]